MLAHQISESSFPALSPEDNAGFALQLMEDYEIAHLPVVDEGKFSGIISKDDLLDVNETSALSTFSQSLIHASVLADEHVLTLLKISDKYQLSLIAVVNANKELRGVITRKNLLHQLALFLNVEEPGGIVVLEMDRRSFSFGEISRLIETNDAFITQLNTYSEGVTGLFIVTIKISKNEISAIIATLQRYDYSIRYYFGEEEYENELKENYHLLMTYLNI